MTMSKYYFAENKLHVLRVLKFLPPYFRVFSSAILPLSFCDWAPYVNNRRGSKYCLFALALFLSLSSFSSFSFSSVNTMCDT